MNGGYALIDPLYSECSFELFYQSDFFLNVCFANKKEGIKPWLELSVKHCEQHLQGNSQNYSEHLQVVLNFPCMSHRALLSSQRFYVNVFF